MEDIKNGEFWDYVTIPKLCRLTGVHRSLVYQLKRQDKLDFQYINTKPFVKLSDFEKILSPIPLKPETSIKK